MEEVQCLPLVSKKNGGWCPPSSLMDSTMSPKVKTTEGEGVRVCSLARNISGVKGCVGAPGWGLGRLTRNSITHMDLHKPNNKLVSAQLEHFGAQTNYEQTQTHKISPRPKLGGSHHLPSYSIFCAPKCHFVLGFPSGSPKIFKIRTSITLEAHNFVCRHLIEVRSKAKL